MAYTGINESIRAYIQERMLVYDSSIDTSTGSEFDRMVIVPLLNRIGPDPTDTSAEQIIEDRLAAHNPSIHIERGTAMRDHFITPLSEVLEPIRRIGRLMYLRASWDDVEYMTNEEADKLAEDVFYSRDPGAKSVGTLRIKFSNPRDVTVTPLNVAYAGKLRFLPTVEQGISRTRMSTQTDGPYYYMDVSLVAEKAGSEYNISRDTITSIDGLTGYVALEQAADFGSGRDSMTNLELKNAAQESITIRNLVTERALKTVLPDSSHFPTIQRLIVVGRADAGMTRDLVRGVASIGGVPQGIKGSSAPAISVSDTFHIGGFTDVWVAPSTDDTVGTLDIYNLEDEGQLVYSAVTGTVNSGSLRRLDDDRAFFTEDDGELLPVVLNDVIRIESNVTAGEYDEYSVSLVSDKYLSTYPVSMSGPLSNAGYEIRRYETGYLDVSLDTLVAVDSSGDPVLDVAGNPYLPKPGLGRGSEGVLSVVNQCVENISLPLVRIVSVEILDSVTLEPSGTYISEADPIVMYVYDRAADDIILIRVVYRRATRFLTESTQEYFSLDETAAYTPLSLSGAANITANNLVQITGVDYTDSYTGHYVARTPQVGDCITIYDPAAPTVTIEQGVIVTVNHGGSSNTYEVEGTPFTPGALGLEARITQGTRMTDMTDVDEFGFYVFDFLASRTLGSRQDVGTTVALPSSAINSQGWRIVPRLEGYSFSTLEEPLLRFTDTVNDTVPMSGENIRVTYTTTPVVADIQDFVDTDEERVTGEDILIRRMPNALVHLAISYKFGSTASPSESQAETSLGDYVDAWVASSDVDYGSATALSNVLEELGVSKVSYPFSTIVEHSSKIRSGRARHGKLLSFHSYDGFLIPDNIAEAIAEIYDFAHFVAGIINPSGS